MDNKKILSMVDHTLLKQTATWEDIKVVLDKAIENDCASACIPPCYVPQANYYVNGNLTICTVIGFPNGYSATEVKCFETKQAIMDGAGEIDMVINIGWVKAREFDKVRKEIEDIRKICNSHIVKVPLKVIIETCLLTNEEIRRLCHIIDAAGADYVKTSTGFSTAGATPEVMAVIKEEVDEINKVNAWGSFYPNRERLLIKASGGIKNFDDAKMYVEEYGANRLGTSRLIN